MIRSKVDLPQPEGPTKVKNSPSLISTLRFFNTWVDPNDLEGLLAAKKELPDLVNWLLENPTEKGIEQPFVGRSFLSSQIRLEHVNDIHNLRNDQTIKILKEQGITKRPFKLYSVIR